MSRRNVPVVRNVSRRPGAAAVESAARDFLCTLPRSYLDHLGPVTVADGRTNELSVELLSRRSLRIFAGFVDVGPVPRFVLSLSLARLMSAQIANIGDLRPGGAQGRLSSQELAGRLFSSYVLKRRLPQVIAFLPWWVKLLAGPEAGQFQFLL